MADELIPAGGDGESRSEPPPLSPHSPHSAEEVAEGTALILYHLFEDPHYFLSWGAKGYIFYVA